MKETKPVFEVKLEGRYLNVIELLGFSDDEDMGLLVISLDLINMSGEAIEDLRRNLEELVIKAGTDSKPIKDFGRKFITKNNDFPDLPKAG